MKLRYAALAAPLLAMATPAHSLVVVHTELDLSTSVIRTTSVQALTQTLTFAPVTIRPNDRFEFRVDFAPGQSLSIIDDTTDPVVQLERILLTVAFPDGVARNFNYSMDVLGTTGDFKGGFEGVEFRTRSSAPNLANGSPADLTDSSFSFTGVSWTGLMGGTLTPVTLSSFVFEARADGLAINLAPAVPEPAGWTMMIAGFGVAGAALRRRKTGTRAVAA